MMRYFSSIHIRCNYKRLYGNERFNSPWTIRHWISIFSMPRDCDARSNCIRIMTIF